MTQPENIQGGRSEHYGNRRYRASHNIIRFAMKGLGTKVSGLENVEKIQNCEEGTILTLNHRHLLDITSLTLPNFDRRLAFMGKEELWKMPGVGVLISFLAKHAGAFPVDRSDPLSKKHALYTAVEKLNNGELVPIFAEGTRNKESAELQKFKTGPARAATMAEGITWLAPGAVGYNQKEGSSRILLRNSALVFGESIAVEQDQDPVEVGLWLRGEIERLRDDAIDLAHSK